MLLPSGTSGHGPTHTPTATLLLPARWTASPRRRRSAPGPAWQLTFIWKHPIPRRWWRTTTALQGTKGDTGETATGEQGDGHLGLGSWPWRCSRPAARRPERGARHGYA